MSTVAFPENFPLNKTLDIKLTCVQKDLKEYFCSPKNEGV